MHSAAYASASASPSSAAWANELMSGPGCVEEGPSDAAPPSWSVSRSSSGATAPSRAGTSASALVAVAGEGVAARLGPTRTGLGSCRRSERCRGSFQPP